jgi:hypothetical protein
VPAVHGGEDQRVHDPAPPGPRVVQQAHLPEVDLALGARLAVRHPHRRPPAATVAQHLQGVPVQRPLRHHHALPGQQLAGLDHRQARIQQLLQPRVTGRQQRPALAVPVAPVRADPLGHGAEQLIAELPLAPGPGQAARPRRFHIPADGLAVYPRQPGHRAEPSPRSHSRSTSLISCTPTSRNATAASQIR